MIQRMTDPYRNTANPEWPTSLTDFLLARLGEDEALWQMAVDAELAFTARNNFTAVPPKEFARRMLADVASKRAIVDAMGDDWVTRNLAAVYADHPEYRDEWRP